MDCNIQSFQDVVSPQRRRYFRKKLLEWHHTNRRSFPWRRTKDAYKILVAEMLLQQTDAPKVAREYKHFIELFDAPRKLANAKRSTVHRFIKRLGLDYRVDRLINLATDIEQKFNGVVPDTEKGLLCLPGVGKYMASAVLASAYKKRVAVLDTNVIRIIERFFGIKSCRSRPRTDPALWLVANQLLPRRADMCKKWNYALLDFAALVCTHYHPNCDLCTLRRRCDFLSKMSSN